MKRVLPPHHSDANLNETPPYMLFFGKELVIDVTLTGLDLDKSGCGAVRL